MANEIQEMAEIDNHTLPFGLRLKTTREAIGLDRKEVAKQLRLSEHIIATIEKDSFPTDLPATFLRGYLRAYGKLLHLPEEEISKAISPIQHKPIQDPTRLAPKQLSRVNSSGNYAMQIFTYLILATLFALVGLWWYTHSIQVTTPLVDNRMQNSENLPLEFNPPVEQPSSASTVEANAQPIVENKQPILTTNSHASTQPVAPAMPKVAESHETKMAAMKPPQNRAHAIYNEIDNDPDGDELS